LPPRKAFDLGARQKRAWVTAPEPELSVIGRNNLSRIEAGNLAVVDAARQRFQCTLHQVRRSTAENQETGTHGLAIGQQPQQLEERRLSLKLVDDYQPSKRLENLFGDLSPQRCLGILEIEVRLRTTGQLAR
jgi:hypothetical protein